MSGRNVAIRYARALYDVALNKQMLGIIITDLAKIDEIMSRVASVREYCLKAHDNKVLEMQFIENAFIPYVSSLTGDMLKIAVSNGRLAALPYLLAALTKIQDVKSGTMEVTLESAREIELHEQQIIAAKMQKRIGKKIKLNNLIIPEILGGIRILWDNRMIDLSVTGRLKIMRTLFKAV
ncbi:ATP synthase F1 subunit delta [candidate division KSB1 bacterium]|nr:MAG: ATP synthase F1 subunit delta [candidate division KSB1 bacterium]